MLHKRTNAGAVGLSAKCQQRKKCIAANDTGRVGPLLPNPTCCMQLFGVSATEFSKLQPAKANTATLVFFSVHLDCLYDLGQLIEAKVPREFFGKFLIDFRQHYFGIGLLVP